MSKKNIKPEELRLFAVTDSRWLGTRTLASDVEAAIKGGATLIELREKDDGPGGWNASGGRGKGPDECAMCNGRGDALDGWKNMENNAAPTDSGLSDGPGGWNASGASDRLDDWKNMENSAAQTDRSSAVGLGDCDLSGKLDDCDLSDKLDDWKNMEESAALTDCGLSDGPGGWNASGASDRLDDWKNMENSAAQTDRSSAVGLDDWKNMENCAASTIKNAQTERLIALTKELVALTHSYGVKLILNDRPEIALAAGADGVHVGQSDMPAAEARRILGPEKIIGVSAHNVAEARAAEAAGADYIGAGAVFSTSTKGDASPLTKAELAEICAAVSIPVVAIGGIDAGNVGALAGTGIAGAAVVSAIFAAGKGECVEALAHRKITEAAKRMAAAVGEMLGGERGAGAAKESAASPERVRHNGASDAGRGAGGAVRPCGEPAEPAGGAPLGDARSDSAACLRADREAAGGAQAPHGALAAQPNGAATCGRQQAAGGAYKAAIFDYDGTILDSMPMWKTAASDYIRERLGREPMPGLDEKIKRGSLEESAHVFRDEYGDTGTDEEITMKVLEYVIDCYRYDLPCKPGIRDILDDLKAHGVRMVVATASLKEMIEVANERLGLTHYFEEVFTCMEIGANKRKPDIYYHAAEYFGTAPAETLVFEDVSHAAISAHDAGFAVIGMYDEDSEKDADIVKANSMLYLPDNNAWPGYEHLPKL